MAELKALKGYIGKDGKKIPVHGGINGSDVIDGFDSTSITAASSANNARVLNERINNLEIGSITSIPNYAILEIIKKFN